MVEKTSTCLANGLSISIAYDPREFNANEAVQTALDEIEYFDDEFEPLGNRFVSKDGNYDVRLQGSESVYVTVAPLESPGDMVLVQVLSDTDIKRRIDKNPRRIVAESSLVQFMGNEETLSRAMDSWLLRTLPAKNGPIRLKSVVVQSFEPGESPPIEIGSP